MLYLPAPSTLSLFILLCELPQAQMISPASPGCCFLVSLPAQPQSSLLTVEHVFFSHQNTPFLARINFCFLAFQQNANSTSVTSSEQRNKCLWEITMPSSHLNKKPRNISYQHFYLFDQSSSSHYLQAYLDGSLRFLHTCPSLLKSYSCEPSPAKK